MTAPSNPAWTSPHMSVVVPVYNEGAGLSLFIESLRSQLDKLALQWDIVLVDDGSSDNTWAVIDDLVKDFQHIRGIRFTRNFGKEAALFAGLKASQGSIIVTIDADGQHPPEHIGTMLERWREGAKIVHGVKKTGSYETAFGRVRAGLFNAVLSRLGQINMQGSSDFKLLDREAVDVMVQSMPEHQRFYRGLADWMGFPSADVPFTVRTRQVGSSQWTVLKLASMASVALISFTSAPLRIITVLGVVTLLFGFVVGAEALVSWFRGEAVSGFATLIISLLLIGSFIMISLGIIGEYIAKIYDEIKGRPIYIIDAKKGFASEDENSPERY